MSRKKKVTRGHPLHRFGRSRNPQGRHIDTCRGLRDEAKKMKKSLLAMMQITSTDLTNLRTEEHFRGTAATDSSVPQLENIKENLTGAILVAERTILLNLEQSKDHKWGLDNIYKMHEGLEASHKACDELFVAYMNKGKKSEPVCAVSTTELSE